MGLHARRELTAAHVLTRAWQYGRLSDVKRQEAAKGRAGWGLTSAARRAILSLTGQTTYQKEP